MRARLVSRRTATINQIRAFLMAHGIAVRTGSGALRRPLFAILENRADELSPRMSDLIVGLYEDWLGLDERIETLTGEIESIPGSVPSARRRWSPRSRRHRSAIGQMPRRALALDRPH